MKKLLLLAAGTFMSLTASAQWAVVGNYCDWSFQSAATFSGEGETLTCSIQKLTTDFKIVDITNDNWETQYGTGTPILLGQPYVLDAKNGGPDPANINFGDDIIAVENAVVSWTPSTATLSITGDAIRQAQDGSVIYLIGDPNKWNVSNGDYPLNAISENVYQATFDLAAGNLYFRFYTKLGQWGNDGALPSIGPLPNDNTNVPVTFTDGVFNGTCEPGKGSWHLEWNGGLITMLVDMENWTVTFTEGSAGVESLVDENVPAVYYNLQGVKVENPSKGIYVVKQGDKTRKVFIK